MKFEGFFRRITLQPRHKIDKTYNKNLRHRRRWKLTIEWLRQFDIKGRCLDCGGKSNFTNMLEANFQVKVYNTTHNLDWWDGSGLENSNIFAFEVIEHLHNDLLFMNWLKVNLMDDGMVFMSTPIFRPKWMRNKEQHCHEYNYNELIELIDTAGFKIMCEKIIQPTQWYFAFTGIRPLIRVLGWDRNILLALKKK